MRKSVNGKPFASKAMTPGSSPGLRANLLKSSNGSGFPVQRKTQGATV